MTGFAAACSSKHYSDDDDDGGDSGDSGSGGSSANGGSSAKGGTSGSSAKGGTSSSGGSSGTLGSGGSSGSSYVSYCGDVCDRASVCPDADPVSCSNGCAVLSSLVTGNVCKAEIMAFTDCGATTSDICSAEACEVEGYALENCIYDYCLRNTSAAICQPTDV